MTDDYFTRLGKITWHQDIPTATPTIYSQYSVMELAHKNVTVLLDGQGADEMFGGYLSYVVHHLRTQLRLSPLSAIPELTTFMGEVRSRFNASLNMREFGHRVYRYLAQGNRPLSLLKPEAEALAVKNNTHYPKRILKGAEPLNALLYQALVRDSLPSLLHYEDRNSMAFGIEARVPFLDHRIVEFALALPAGSKIRGAETKRVLRGAMRGTLPDEIIDRRDKLGFPTPFSQWLRGDLRSQAEAILLDSVIQRDWIEAQTVRTLWNEHLSGQRDWGAVIHRLISAELWYSQQAA
jgi:asparagine synthase (glutamine-hydrolysing)